MIKYIVKVWVSFWQFLKGLGTRKKWVAVVAAILIIGFVGFVFFGPQSEGEDPLSETPRTVSLLPVSELSEEKNTLNVGGTETVVRAEAAGKIVTVLPIGIRVLPGATIAQFENATERASLLQAEGSLEVAEASLEKTQSGLRSEKIAVLESAVTSAENGAVATLLSAYGTVDSAVRDTADEMFSNANTAAPKINFASNDNQRRNEIQNTRVALGLILDRQVSVSATLSSDSDIAGELTTTENELRAVRSFIDSLIAALNEAIPTGIISNSDIATYKSAATKARTALTSTLSSIASSRGSLETAQQNLEEALSGAEDTEVAASLAAVKQAQGAYNAALAAYNKTIVRAPKGGTILSCNANEGDVLSIGSDICRIQTAVSETGNTFTLPLESVKYTPRGAFVFIMNENKTLEGIAVETGLVTAGGITVTGLFGDEFIVRDVRGLKNGETVRLR